MKIEELFPQTANGESAATASDYIQKLKSHRYLDLPDVESANKSLNPKEHDINDPILRPDKKVKIDAGDDMSNAESARNVIDVTDGESENKGNYRTEKVARVAVAIQKLIVNRAVSFCFGNPPSYNAAPENEGQELVLKAFNRIMSDVKCNSLNRKVARSIFSYKDAAEYWFPSEQKAKHKKYGFETPFKLRCVVFSPKNGDVLYPYFDESGDMVAFSRAFAHVDGEKNRYDYFETWTDEEHWLWLNGKNGYEVVEGFPKKIEIGKIPVIFGHQDHYECEDIDKLVDRLEKLLSNFADTNDYHASPKIFTTGDIKGWAKKGESGAVIEGEEGATMEYVSWQQAPESVKLEIETLLKMIYTITQTPDISFDAVKGLGAISGLALKLLFMDAHLKVQDKREIFDEYLQRRVNVVKAWIGYMNGKVKNDADEIDIEPEIIPYMLTSEIDELNYWMTANGNKPVISQEESVASVGISKNPEMTMQKLKEQSDRENSFTIGEPIIDDVDDDDPNNPANKQKQPGKGGKGDEE